LLVRSEQTGEDKPMAVLAREVLGMTSLR
jgi:hypothetical protein